MDEEEDLETYGEQLYALIHPEHKENAGKLTGTVACMVSFWFVDTLTTGIHISPQIVMKKTHHSDF